ncbi:MAG: protein kinase domain-containing protein [Gemmatimonadaceae bacterium]
MDTTSTLKAALGGRYEIEREIGAGGMATVYLARDVRHDRSVALKVLRPELAAVIGGERFLQEIKVTANLHHPHILPLHDSGQVDGIVFYVMPYVGGESLRARLDRETQLRIDSAVRIATEVASALDYAHRHGVIHRDMKPENILLHDGAALVVDFGIALAVTSAGAQRVTETGLSLGTPHYMSPEQAMGEREITHKTDVYALGCVLYEMLIGEPPFTGPSAQAIIARVITEEPRSPTGQRKTIPLHIEQALLTALAKLPADRFESAAKFADALQGKTFALSMGAVTPTRGVVAAPAARAWSTRLVAGTTLFAAVMVAGAGGWAWLSSRGGELQSPVRFVLTLPRNAPTLEGAGPLLALTPNGRSLVYQTHALGSSLLYRREADKLAPTPIAGTERAKQHFLSPDGRWVAFFNGSELRKVPIDGGPPTTIASVTGPWGASWGPNNVIVLGGHPGVDGLSRVAASGGSPSPFTTPDSASGELSQRWPKVLADGKTVLYTSWGSGGLQTARIGIASLETGECTVLDIVGSAPLGIYEGHLIYARADGALMAVPFHLRSRRATGNAVIVEEGVTVGSLGASKAALSENGALAYMTGSGTSRLVVVGTNGTLRPIISEPRAYESPRFSPDGRRIALAVLSRPSDVWVYDIAAGTFARLTSEAANIRPEWTPDGKRIVFLSNRSGEMGIWWRAADASAPPQKVFESKDDALEAVVAPDGGVLVYRANQSDGSYGVRFQSLADFTTPKPFFSTSRYQWLMPSLSPDGRWLAYVSDETGATEVYVRPFPGPAAQYAVSAGGGSEPRWASDGRRLFYRRGRQMLAAWVNTAPTFSVTGRAVLFEGNYSTNTSHQNYDVTPDGQGFLMLQPDTDAELVVVLNWLSELRTRIRAAAPK